MSDNDIVLADQNTTPKTFNPRFKDRGGNIREAVHGVSNNGGTQIDPATEQTLNSVLTALGLISKDSTSAKDASLSAINTALGLVAKDSTVAKDSSLSTINTTLGAIAKDSTVAKDSSLATIITALGLVAKDSTVAKDSSLSTINTTLSSKATSADITNLIAKDEQIRTILAGVLSVILPADQDPVFDHVNGVRVALTANTSTLLITPANGCKYIRINSEVDVFINTNNNAASDAATSVKIMANSPEVIPVIAGSTVNMFSTLAGIVRATPMKVR